MAKKMGFVDRLVLGAEKSEGYARASLPSNRWELFWDILKGSFWRLVLINLLIVLFLIPLFALLILHKIALSGMGAMGPFNQVFGVGYQGVPNMNGFAEQISFNATTSSLLFLPLTAFFVSISLAGGAYIMRNIVWTEGIFVANDFWRGIKENYLKMLMISLVYSLVFYISTIILGFISQMSALQGGSVLLTICEIIVYLVMILYTIMSLHMVTMTVTYELPIKALFRNSAIITIGLAPQNLFFLFLGSLPFLIMGLGEFFEGIGYVILVLISFSLFLLVWTNYSQWVYDKFINDKVPGAKKNRGIYEKIKGDESESIRKHKEQIILAQHTALNSRPIKPITDDELQLAELPTSFSRKDLEKLQASKQAIYDDHDRYVEEHKNDEKYKLTEDEIALKKVQDEKAKRIEKAKKELAKRNKK
ncbi:MAG: hypothetical protein IKW33_03305 [Clostridia bacterium]|nr:hypothetical protein [Clostridia bacterium]